MISYAMSCHDNILLCMSCHDNGISLGNKILMSYSCGYIIRKSNMFTTKLQSVNYYCQGNV